MNDNAYQNALDYLYSFIDHSLTRNLRYAEEKFDLSRMITLMNILGNPQKDYDVVHIAGTKGKGSTCSMITSILRNQGYRVGFYSSPHMIDFRERIQINRDLISKEEFVGQIEEMKGAIENVQDVSTFEITTALAFKYFSDKKIDIAVIEVGMGGRLDATNVVYPMLSVITSISLDHTNILGDTISKIAGEKAGIIKKSIPVVIGRQVDDAKVVLKRVAAENNSPLIDVMKEYQWKQLDYSLRQQRFSVKRNGNAISKGYDFEVTMSLIGDHQLDNALTAIAAVENLPKKYPVSHDAIQRGLAEAYWPGRFEVIHQDPLIIIDGAHNPDSFEKLSAAIDKFVSAKRPTLIFGASEDKDIAQMISIILPSVDKIIFTKSAHPRAMNEDEIREQILPFYCDDFVFMDIEVLTREILQNTEGVYIASGSIFIAGAVQENIINIKNNETS